MLVKSTGKLGDRITLLSPLYRAGHCANDAEDDRYKRYSTFLKFNVYIHQQDDPSSSLEVIVLSDHGSPIETVYDNRKERNWHYNKWKKWQYADLPEVGSYHLMFVVELGRPFASDVMLDHVIVGCQQWPMSPPGIQKALSHYCQPHIASYNRCRISR